MVTWQYGVGTVRRPNLKERADRAPADAAPRHQHCRTRELAARATIPLASPELFPVTSSAFLRAATAAPLCTRAAPSQQSITVYAVSVPRTGSAEAETMQAVITHYRTTAGSTAFKGVASSMIEDMTRTACAGEALHDCRQSIRPWLYVETGQPPLHSIATVTGPHCSVKEIIV